MEKQEEALHCSECGSVSSESVDPPEDAPLVYGCDGCSRLSCDNCGSGGLCSSCDADQMAGCDDDY